MIPPYYLFSRSQIKHSIIIKGKPVFSFNHKGRGCVLDIRVYRYKNGFIEGAYIHTPLWAGGYGASTELPFYFSTLKECLESVVANWKRQIIEYKFRDSEAYRQHKYSTILNFLDDDIWNVFRRLSPDL